MEREIHRLERLISEKEETITRLTNSNKQLDAGLSAANKQIQSMKDKAILNFSYSHVPDRQIIQTLEAKIAASAWQILQLQKINSKYEESIIKLQQQIFHYQRQLTLLQAKQSEQIITDTSMQQQIKSSHILEAWETVLEEKEKLIEENLMLKESLKDRQSETAQKMAFYLSEVSNLSEKIKNQHLNQKTRYIQFENNIKELKKQNQTLRQTLNKKNQQIMAFYQQSKLISTTKAEDLHTIRNLRAEIKKKSEQYLKILKKVSETEEIKVQLMQHHDTIAKRVAQSEKILDNYEATKRENGVLKQKMMKAEQKGRAIEKLIDEINQKLLQLLIQNEACHELLYEARGYSNVFMKDIEKKVERFLQILEKRRQNCSQWLDVSELIAVNQKLRTKDLICSSQ